MADVEFNPGGASSLEEATVFHVDNYQGNQDWRKPLADFALVNPGLAEISASRMLNGTDHLKRVRGNSGTAITLTIPTDASEALPVDRFPVENIGAGAMTVTMEAGATLNGVDGGSLTLTQYQALVIEKIAADTWIAFNVVVS